MKRALALLARGRSSSRDLSPDEAQALAQGVLDPATSPVQVSAALTALRLKPETAGELAAFIQALRQNQPALTLDPALTARALLVAGGPVGRDSFHASMAASVLCSLAGQPTLIQGGEPLPPRPGLALSALLASFDVDRGPTTEPEQAGQDLEALGLAYLDVEAWCPALGRLRPLRQDLGYRTILHLAERFILPLGLGQLLVGLPHVPALERVRALGPSLGPTRVVAVLGLDSSEDLPTHKPVQILLVEGGQCRDLVLDAADLGLAAQPRRGLSLEDQHSRVAAVLGGEAGKEVEAERRQVLWNTACRLWLFGRALSLGEGLEQAQDLLKSGRGLTRLMQWSRRSKALIAEARP